MVDMPISPVVLAIELQSMPLTTSLLTAQQEHAAAFKRYMLGLVTVPLVLPAAHDAAEIAMTAALVGQNEPPPIGAQAVNNGYLAYVTAIVTALVAQSGGTWALTIPPAPTGPLVSSSYPPNFGATAYAQLVHQWVVAIAGGTPLTGPAFWL
jgi:hypothetical protein